MSDEPTRPALALVVDDDDGMRMTVSESLESAGLRVEEAENGALAVAAFERLAPDIVLLDVMMPEMDGFQACAALRKTPSAKHTPVLMMTGLDDLESINRAYDAGATDFITKPLNYVLLGHRVRYMLRARRAMLKVERTMDQLRRSERRRANAQRIARLGNWEWDAASNQLEVSDELCEIMALSPERFTGHHRELLHTVHIDDQETVAKAFERCLARGEAFSVEHRVVTDDGTERTIHQEAEAVRNPDDSIKRIIGTAQDITERKATEHKIVHLAYYDSLTGLPNRAFLREHLNHLVGQAKRYERSLAVLSMDLDLFKRINDSLGHSVGDHLLKLVAGRIATCMRDSDFFIRIDPSLSGAAIPGSASGDTVARLGGDEFIMVLSDLRRPEDAAVAAQRIVDAMSKPFLIDDEEVYVTTSIGITIYPGDGGDVETLLQSADAAMHHAKEHGRNCYQFYMNSMNTKASERLSLGNSLYRALERNEFELHYQPRVDIRKGMVVGAEALVRWWHPERGMVSPATFIPLAEENGVINALGEWVIREACKQGKRWQELALGRIQVAVNLSSRQFKDRGLARTIESALNDSALAPSLLEVELTEGTLMEDSQNNIAILSELKELGVHIALDDFGTGYSSLGYLNRLPIDVLKVDRSFVKDIAEGANSATIAAAVIALSRSLRLGVIAEGVETEAQLEFMYRHECYEIQGNYFSQPLSAAALQRWLENPPCLAPFARAGERLAV